MKPALAIALRLARLWAAIYTLGAPRELKRDRLTELDSDLWEHLAFASASSEPFAKTAADIVHRTIRGIPADLAWRFHLHASGEASWELVYGADGSVSLARRHDSWLDRNAWIWLLGILLLFAGGMWWLLDSTRPSRLTFEMDAPDYLIVSDSNWTLRARCCGRRDNYSWDDPRRTVMLTITNGSSHTARARIAGWDALPHEFDYSYGAIETGAIAARRAIDALLEDYSRGLGHSRVPLDFADSFVASELPAFVEEFGNVFGTDLGGMDDVWARREAWLGSMPRSPVCIEIGQDSPDGCSNYLVIPPGSTVEVAIVINAPVGTGWEEGYVRGFDLRLVDYAAE